MSTVTRRSTRCSLALHVYDAATLCQAEPYQFQLAPQAVPSFILARGTYRTYITYTADNHSGVLRFEDFTFNIV